MSESRSWAFAEAARLAAATEGKDVVVFETGYGPSGLPHIGTVAEVVRTKMVERAFREITGKETRLYVFSDDMDALRKAPKNVPNRDMLERSIGRPLSQVPNPFGNDHASFSAHNNAALKGYLSRFGFEDGRDYTFMSASECYGSGRFDATLSRLAESCQTILDIILPTLGDERRASYCPFLPIVDGVVHHEVFDFSFGDGVISFTDAEGRFHESHPLWGGGVKCQWKVDWPMRWIALGVDYEMHGKDLTPSVRLGDAICRAVGGRPPEHMVYELFLDESGGKQSKSVGNGLDLRSWLDVSPSEAIKHFLFQNPKKARKLFFDMVPQAVDRWLDDVAKWSGEKDSAVWLAHGDDVPKVPESLSYSTMLNIAEVANASDGEGFLSFLLQHRHDLDRDDPLLRSLADGAAAYYVGRVVPFRNFRGADEDERKVLLSLADVIESLDGQGLDAEGVQCHVYEVGKAAFGKDRLRDFFRMCYEVLFGKEQGPRFGTFAHAFGLRETAEFIRRRVSEPDVAM